MSLIKITTSQNIDIEYELAGPGERIGAFFIDNLIKGALAFVTIMLLTNIHFRGSSDWLFFLLILLPYIFYDLVCEMLMNGHSFGKQAMHIKVVSLDGGQATAGQYIIRWLFRPVDFYMTAYLCSLFTVGFSKRNQRLGDMVAGTIVIKTHTTATFQQTLFVPDVQGAEHTVAFPEAANLTDREIQLVKEVILLVQQNGNTSIAYQAAEKIKRTINVKSSLDPMIFLHTLLEDHNHLTSM